MPKSNHSMALPTLVAKTALLAESMSTTVMTSFFRRNFFRRPLKDRFFSISATSLPSLPATAFPGYDEGAKFFSCITADSASSPLYCGTGSAGPVSSLRRKVLLSFPSPDRAEGFEIGDQGHEKQRH